MARQTRSFIDLDASFTVNPRTRDVATKTDDNAVRNALRNLIFTKHYDRPFQPDLGCQLDSLLFEQLDEVSIMVAEQIIRNSIAKYEPRIEILKIEVRESTDNEVFISIEYKLKNSQLPAIFTTTFTRVR